MFKDIKEFHKEFQLPVEQYPNPLPPELSTFRIKFMLEELNEYIEATINEDVEGQADALVDLVYVALGTALMHGFPFDELWDEVHRVNMTKVRAKSSVESKRGSDFDVVKPPGWTGPDIKRILNEFGAELP